MSAPASRHVRAPAGAVVSAVLILAVGAAVGFFFGRFSVESPDGIARPAVQSMLTDRVAALNEGDEERLSDFYSDDAVLEEWDQGPEPVVTTGAEQIARHLGDYQAMGFRVATESAAIQYGAVAPFVGEALSWSGQSGGVVVYEFDAEGRIAHQWVFGRYFRESDLTDR